MIESSQERERILRDPVRNLTAFGFEPDIPTYVIHYMPTGDEPKPGTITVDMLKRALFESTYARPVVIPFVYDPGEGLSWELPMVVELAQALYIPAIREGREGPALGCWEYPDWYLRGYLHKSPFDASVETTRMHVYITTDGGSEDLGTAIVQLAHFSTQAVTDTPALPDPKPLGSS